jgi:hypothetical protein
VWTERHRAYIPTRDALEKDKSIIERREEWKACCNNVMPKDQVTREMGKVRDARKTRQGPARAAPQRIVR